jgi:hypothetical protein
MSAQITPAASSSAAPDLRLTVASPYGWEIYLLVRAADRWAYELAVPELAGRVEGRISVRQRLDAHDLMCRHNARFSAPRG